SVEERHIGVGLIDATRRTLPRKPERLTGHDRVFLVGPHVELLYLLPELWLVHRATELAEARRRVELEVARLVGGAVARRHLRRPAAPAAVPHVVADPVVEGPHTGQVRMAAHAWRLARGVRRGLLLRPDRRRKLRADVHRLLHTRRNRRHDV